MDERDDNYRRIWGSHPPLRLQPNEAAMTTPSAQALEPCPFCGSSATVSSLTTGHAIVVCNNCVAMGPRRGEAIAAWNRRPSPADGRVREAVIAIRDEYVARYQRRDSEYLGACVDAANHIVETIAALASPSVPEGREVLPKAESVDCAHRQSQNDYKIVAIYADPQDAATAMAALKRPTEGDA